MSTPLLPPLPDSLLAILPPAGDPAGIKIVQDLAAWAKRYSDSVVGQMTTMHPLKGV